jgi:hypothetical protein
MPWNWLIQGQTFHCFKDQVSRQLQAKLHEPSVTPFHDAELMQATKDINKILDRVRNKDPNRTLSFIVFKDQPLLVWATYGAVSPDDEEATIARTLGLSPQ